MPRQLSEEHKKRMLEGRRTTRRTRKPRKVSEINQSMMPVRSESIPERYLKPVRDAYSGRASYRGATKAKCIECVNFEDVINRIRGCTARRCPIWNYRPFKVEEGQP